MHRASLQKARELLPHFPKDLLHQWTNGRLLLSLPLRAISSGPSSRFQNTGSLDLPLPAVPYKSAGDQHGGNAYLLGAPPALIGN